MAAAAFGLGLILGPIALGAAAIALLGASIIPLAFALNLAAPALESFGKIFLGFASIMINALEAIIGGILSFAKIVGPVTYLLYDFFSNDLLPRAPMKSIFFEMFQPGTMQLSEFASDRERKATAKTASDRERQATAKN